VFAEEEARLLVASGMRGAELDALVERRMGGLPLEHVLGWAAFCGLRIVVTPGVFVPRPRTAFLVAQAAARTPRGAVLVDLCCGSGAVGAAIAAREPGLELYAVDIDPVAAACARQNLGPAARVYVGDLYDPLPAGLMGHIDVLVCNAPYVPTDAIALLPREARLFEPRHALDGGVDGLDLQRHVAEAAPRWLAPGGAVLFETSERQSPACLEILHGAGLVGSVARDDELDATVAIGRLRPSDEGGLRAAAISPKA
jgi:release factor glutamine methyltransferase